jgi:hypothetical protein
LKNNELKNELQNIISGKSSNGNSSLVQTVANYLRTGKRASPMAEEKYQNKKEETTKLIQFAEQHNLLIKEIDESKFISSGAEQKVYIHNEQFVIKLNDSIYYASWEDYFHNLLLNNYFFPDTAYELIGFYQDEEKFYAVVRQVFVKADTITNLNSVKEFLLNNGFLNTKNFDFYNPELGVILEDLHDENVITNQNVLYFIDTVFYIVPETFWD